MTSTATSRPPPPPIPSHSAFMLAQVRSSLAHLRSTSDIDDDTFQSIDRLLTNSKDGSGKSQAVSKSQSEEERLGNNNAWLRNMLLETDLLANTVELALNIAVPSGLLGSAQKQSILELVEISKVKVANAITDPSLQKKTSSGAWSSAKGAHLGIRKGLSAAGQSVGELARKREQSRMKGELKKSEKEEKKAIKEELKREREEIVRKRQMDMLAGSSDSSSPSKFEKSKVAGDSESEPSSSVAIPISQGAASTSRKTSLREYNQGAPMASKADGDAMVSVSCSQLSSTGHVAATTTFSPWPGLLLTNTLIATNDEESEDSYQSDDYTGESLGQSQSGNLTSLPPPPRRVAQSNSNEEAQ